MAERLIQVGNTRLRRKRTLPVAAQFPYHLSTVTNGNPIPVGTSSPNIFGAGEFSMQLMIKWFGPMPTNPYRTVGTDFVSSDTQQFLVLAGGQGGYSVLLQYYYGRLYLSTYGAGGSVLCAAFPLVNIWHRLTVVVSYANSYVKFFYDGAEVSNSFFPYPFPDTSKVELASYNNARSYNQFFGLIAEPRFYDIALTAAQVFDTFDKQTADLSNAYKNALVFSPLFNVKLASVAVNESHAFADYTGRYFDRLAAFNGDTVNARVGCLAPQYAPKPGGVLVARREWPAVVGDPYSGPVATPGFYGLYNSPVVTKSGLWYPYTSGAGQVPPAGTVGGGMVNSNPNDGSGRDDNASFEIHFDGSGILLFGFCQDLYGTAQIFIDDEPVEYILYRPGTYSIRVVFKITNLKPGRHIFRHQCITDIDKVSIPQYVQILA